jgi:hypothetical protein
MTISKNLFATRNALISVAVAVPAGTVAGRVIPIGPDGLFGYTLTPETTQADLDNFSKATPQGLKAGQASVELIGISLAVNLTVALAPVLGDRIYRVRADGTYTTAADTGGTTPIANDAIGYALAAGAAGSVVPVALSRV